MIRKANLQDAHEIAKIYNYYIEETIVTFELTPIDAEEMAARISTISSKFPFIVFEENGEVLGYAYASGWRVRKAYDKSVESTVYLKNGEEGKGIGSLLYAQLLEELIAGGFHMVIGGVSLPNPASVALHEKFGFEKVAHFKEVGNKFDMWVDVGYWERRI